MVGRHSSFLVTKRSLRNSDSNNGRRLRQVVQTKNLDDTVGLSRKEEQELNKALYASLQENRRTKALPGFVDSASNISSCVTNSSSNTSGGKGSFKVTRTSSDGGSTATSVSGSIRGSSINKSQKMAQLRKRSFLPGRLSTKCFPRQSDVTGRVYPTKHSQQIAETGASRYRASLSIDESSQDSVRSSTSSNNGSKRKIHAQRKFAQGCSLPGMMSCSPVKLTTPAVKMLSSKVPKTEDFLTFLCLRGSSILPPHLDFFNFSREEPPSCEESSRPVSYTVKNQREDTPDSSSTSSGANEEVAETANVSTPTMTGRSGGGLLAKRSAARASAGTPETARGIVSLRQGLQRKVSTSSSSSSLAQFPASSSCLLPVAELTNTPPSRYRNKFYFTPEKSSSPSKASGVRPGEFTPPFLFSSTSNINSTCKFSPLVCSSSKFASIDLPFGSQAIQSSSSSSSSLSTSTVNGASKRKRQLTVSSSAENTKVMCNHDSSVPSFRVMKCTRLDRQDCLSPITPTSLLSASQSVDSVLPSSSISHTSFINSHSPRPFSHSLEKTKSPSLSSGSHSLNNIIYSSIPLHDKIKKSCSYSPPHEPPTSPQYKHKGLKFRYRKNIQDRRTALEASRNCSSEHASSKNDSLKEAFCDRSDYLTNSSCHDCLYCNSAHADHITEPSACASSFQNDACCILHGDGQSRSSPTLEPVYNCKPVHVSNYNPVHVSNSKPVSVFNHKLVHVTNSEPVHVFNHKPVHVSNIKPMHVNFEPGHVSSPKPFHVSSSKPVNIYHLPKSDTSMFDCVNVNDNYVLDQSMYPHYLCQNSSTVSLGNSFNSCTENDCLNGDDSSSSSDRLEDSILNELYSDFGTDRTFSTNGVLDLEVNVRDNRHKQENDRNMIQNGSNNDYSEKIGTRDSHFYHSEESMGISDLDKENVNFTIEDDNVTFSIIPTLKIDKYPKSKSYNSLLRIRRMKSKKHYKYHGKNQSKNILNERRNRKIKKRYCLVKEVPKVKIRIIRRQSVNMNKVSENFVESQARDLQMSAEKTSSKPSQGDFQNEFLKMLQADGVACLSENKMPAHDIRIKPTFLLDGSKSSNGISNKIWRNQQFYPMKSDEKVDKFHNNSDVSSEYDEDSIHEAQPLPGVVNVRFFEYNENLHLCQPEELLDSFKPKSFNNLMRQRKGQVETIVERNSEVVDKHLDRPSKPNEITSASSKTHCQELLPKVSLNEIPPFKAKTRNQNFGVVIKAVKESANLADSITLRDKVISAFAKFNRKDIIGSHVEVNKSSSSDPDILPGSVSNIVSVDSISDTESVNKFCDKKTVNKYSNSKSVNKLFDKTNVNKISQNKTFNKLSHNKCVSRNFASKLFKNQSFHKLYDSKSVIKTSDRKSVNKLSDNRSVKKLPDNKFVLQTYVSKPVNKLTVNRSVINFPDSKSVIKTYKNKSVNKQPDNKSVNKQPGNKSVNKQPDNKSVIKTSRSKFVNKLLDNKSVIKTYKSKSVNKQPDNKSVNKQPDNKSVIKTSISQSINKLLDNKSVNKLPNNRSVNKLSDNKAINKPSNNKYIQVDDKKLVKLTKNKPVYKLYDNKSVNTSSESDTRKPLSRSHSVDEVLKDDIIKTPSKVSVAHTLVMNDSSKICSEHTCSKTMLNENIIHGMKMNSSANWTNKCHLGLIDACIDTERYQAINQANLHKNSAKEPEMCQSVFAVSNGLDSRTGNFEKKSFSSCCKCLLEQESLECCFKSTQTGTVGVSESDIDTNTSNSALDVSKESVEMKARENEKEHSTMNVQENSYLRKKCPDCQCQFGAYINKIHPRVVDDIHSVRDSSTTNKEQTTKREAKLCSFMCKNDEPAHITNSSKKPYSTDNPCLNGIKSADHITNKSHLGNKQVQTRVLDTGPHPTEEFEVLENYICYSCEMCKARFNLNESLNSKEYFTQKPKTDIKFLKSHLPNSDVSSGKLKHSIASSTSCVSTSTQTGQETITNDDQNSEEKPSHNKKSVEVQFNSSDSNCPEFWQELCFRSGCRANEASKNNIATHKLNNSHSDKIDSGNNSLSLLQGNQDVPLSRPRAHKLETKTVFPTPNITNSHPDVLEGSTSTSSEHAQKNKSASDQSLITHDTMLDLSDFRTGDININEKSSETHKCCSCKEARTKSFTVQTHKLTGEVLKNHKISNEDSSNIKEVPISQEHSDCYITSAAESSSSTRVDEYVQDEIIEAQDNDNKDLIIVEEKFASDSNDSFTDASLCSNDFDGFVIDLSVHSRSHSSSSDYSTSLSRSPDVAEVLNLTDSGSSNSLISASKTSVGFNCLSRSSTCGLQQATTRRPKLTPDRDMPWHSEVRNNYTSTSNINKEHSSLVCFEQPVKLPHSTGNSLDTNLLPQYKSNPIFTTSRLVQARETNKPSSSEERLKRFQNMESETCQVIPRKDNSIQQNQWKNSNYGTRNPTIQFYDPKYTSGEKSIDKQKEGYTKKVTPAISYQNEILKVGKQLSSDNAIALHSYGSLNTGHGYAVINGELQHCELFNKQHISSEVNSPKAMASLGKTCNRKPAVSEVISSALETDLLSSRVDDIEKRCERNNNSARQEKTSESLKKLQDTTELGCQTAQSSNSQSGDQNPYSELTSCQHSHRGSYTSCASGSCSERPQETEELTSGHESFDLSTQLEQVQISKYKHPCSAASQGHRKALRSPFSRHDFTQFIVKPRHKHRPQSSTSKNCPSTSHRKHLNFEFLSPCPSKNYTASQKESFQSIRQNPKTSQTCRNNKSGDYSSEARSSHNSRTRYIQETKKPNVLKPCPTVCVDSNQPRRLQGSASDRSILRSAYISDLGQEKNSAMYSNNNNTNHSTTLCNRFSSELKDTSKTTNNLTLPETNMAQKKFLQTSQSSTSSGEVRMNMSRTLHGLNNGWISSHTDSETYVHPNITGVASEQDIDHNDFSNIMYTSQRDGIFHQVKHSSQSHISKSQSLETSSFTATNTNPTRAFVPSSLGISNADPTSSYVARSSRTFQPSSSRTSVVNPTNASVAKPLNNAVACSINFVNTDYPSVSTSLGFEQERISSDGLRSDDLYSMTSTSDQPQRTDSEENVLDVIMEELKIQIALLKEEIMRESQQQPAVMQYSKSRGRKNNDFSRASGRSKWPKGYSSAQRKMPSRYNKHFNQQALYSNRNMDETSGTCRVMNLENQDLDWYGCGSSMARSGSGVSRSGHFMSSSKIWTLDCVSELSSNRDQLTSNMDRVTRSVDKVPIVEDDTFISRDIIFRGGEQVLSSGGEFSNGARQIMEATWLDINLSFKNEFKEYIEISSDGEDSFL